MISSGPFNAEVAVFAQNLCGSVGMVITNPVASTSPTGSSAGNSVGTATATIAGSTSAGNSASRQLDEYLMLFGALGVAGSFFA